MPYLISVITVHLNQRENLRRTLESVSMQDYPQIEHIVIDGASTDGSLELIKQYAPKLAYWVSEPDSGIYAAMNKGAAVAKGDYLIFLNAGDLFHAPSSLRQAVQLFPDNLPDVIYGSVYYETPKGRFERKDYPRKPTLQDLAWRSYCHQAMFLSRALFDQFQYDESLQIVSDWKFYIHAIFLHGASTHYLNFTFTVFGYGGISSQPEGLYIGLKEREKVLKELFPNSYPKLLRQRILRKWLRRLSAYDALQFLYWKMYYLWLRLQGK